MIVVLMGVTGSGKTTIGRMLAKGLEWEFHDADDLHPPQNIQKMRRGEPLTEADRLPWLDSVATLMRQVDRSGRSAVFACSALRESYRRRLAASSPAVRFVFLHAPLDTIASRLEQRAGHFMHPGLVPRQFAALEPPDKAVWVDASAPPEAVVAEVQERLGL